MSIRSNILAGCLSLTLLGGFMGVFAELQGRHLGTLALNIYDNAFMSVSYLREAQIDFSRLAAHAGQPGISADADRAMAEEILADLDVVHDRAMSPAGRSHAMALRAEVASLLPHLATEQRRAANAELMFDRLVETFADDGYHYRKSAAAFIQRQTTQTWVAIALSLFASLGITVVVSQRIAPPVRRAVRIAQSIAAGCLDNPIKVEGRGETANLLASLSVMQANIAAAMARIQALLAEQAKRYSGEIERQHAQMEAALANMTQGLCLFDAEGRLVVANRRFADIFGAPAIGATAGDVLRGAGLDILLDVACGSEIHTLSCDLPDGRSIAVSQQPVASGGWVATYEDISERRVAEQRLAHMARHDQLTGLPNRLLFGEHMQRVLAGRAPNTDIAVLWLDLDRFKIVNDTHGHPIGDALLGEVAARLRECAGGAGLVARLGGDEFAIVQEHGTQPYDATALAQQVITALSTPFCIDGQDVRIGASVGIALSYDGLMTSDSLLKRADLALYRAKADGKGQFRFFEAAMEAHRVLEQDLHRALALEEFEVFYQPLIEVGRGISGFEALLRWRHPQHGLMSPDKFIPLAEEIQLIGPIGEWVLNRACADAATWPADLKVAVNLSPLQFRGDLLRQVTDALQSNGLSATRLELEITESLFLQDEEKVITTLRAIRALGVRIAMDDFGTGYSALSYLQRFPFDKIKIDKSFIQGMEDKSDCLAIIRAVISLGRSLGMMVNAEGVETEAQCASLMHEGCGELQGYLFSRPQPAVAVTSMLLQHVTCGQHVPAKAEVTVSAPLQWLTPPVGPVPVESHGLTEA
jgi:diguanylate cyclase (GGDEF)-like protein